MSNMFCVTSFPFSTGFAWRLDVLIPASQHDSSWAHDRNTSMAEPGHIVPYCLEWCCAPDFWWASTSHLQTIDMRICLWKGLLEQGCSYLLYCFTEHMLCSAMLGRHLLMELLLSSSAIFVTAISWKQWRIGLKLLFSHFRFAGHCESYLFWQPSFCDVTEVISAPSATAK